MIIEWSLMKIAGRSGFGINTSRRGILIEVQECRFVKASTTWAFINHKTYTCSVPQTSRGRRAAKISRSVELALPATLQEALRTLARENRRLPMHRLCARQSSAREQWEREKERLGKRGELPHGDIALV